MNPDLLLSFTVASILITLMPGPDNIFILTESLTKGQKNGFFIALGNAFGSLVHTTAAATGLSLIIQSSALAFSIVKYIGAGYIFYMAIMSAKEKGSQLDLPINKTDKNSGFLSLFRKGFFMSVLNPKVALFFIAFFPQFLDKSGTINVVYQMYILGIIFLLQTIMIFGCLAYFSGKLTRYVQAPKFWKITRWTKVSVLSILGLSLAFSKK